MNGRRKSFSNTTITVFGVPLARLMESTSPPKVFTMLCDFLQKQGSLYTIFI